MVLQLARNPAHASMLSRILDAHQDALLARDSEGSSLLHIAAAAGAGDVCTELLLRGLSPDVVNNAGVRAGEMAAGSACAVLLPDTSSAQGALTTFVEESCVADGDENGTTDLAALPDDVVLCILRGLDGLSDVLTMRAVSGRVHRLMDQVGRRGTGLCALHHSTLFLVRTETRDGSLQDVIWERLCWLHFKRERSSFLAGSWLEVYKEHYIIRVRLPSLDVATLNAHLLPAHALTGGRARGSFAEGAGQKAGHRREQPHHEQQLSRALSPRLDRRPHVALLSQCHLLVDEKDHGFESEL
jgi:hypothetical protein